MKSRHCFRPPAKTDLEHRSKCVKCGLIRKWSGHVIQYTGSKMNSFDYARTEEGPFLKGTGPGGIPFECARPVKGKTVEQETVEMLGRLVRGGFCAFAKPYMSAMCSRQAPHLICDHCTAMEFLRRIGREDLLEQKPGSAGPG